MVDHCLKEPYGPGLDVRFSYRARRAREGRRVKQAICLANLFWFQPDSLGDILIPSFLQPFTGGHGQDVSCELNKV